MGIPARLFILPLVASMAISAAAQPVDRLPDPLQQIDTLRTLKAASDSELKTITPGTLPKEAEFLQLKTRHADLLAEKNRLLDKQNELTVRNTALTQQIKQQSTEKADLMVQVDRLERALRQAEKDNETTAATLRSRWAAKESSPARQKTAQQKTIMPEAVQDSARIESAIKGWSTAWSQQNIQDYLSFYSPEFKPATATSRSTWEKLRKSRLERPQFISISLKDIQVDVFDATSSKITFLQEYRSNSYSDRVTKQLDMRKENGNWKILREQTVKWLSPQTK